MEIKKFGIICDECGDGCIMDDYDNIGDAREESFVSAWNYVYLSSLDEHYDFCPKCIEKILLRGRRK